VGRKRVLSPKTVQLMTSTAVHNVRPGWGYGLGIGVIEDITASGVPGSPGTFGWTGNYAPNSPADPVEHLIIVALASGSLRTPEPYGIRFRHSCTRASFARTNRPSDRERRLFSGKPREEPGALTLGIARPQGDGSSFA